MHIKHKDISDKYNNLLEIISDIDFSKISSKSDKVLHLPITNHQSRTILEKPTILSQRYLVIIKNYSPTTLQKIGQIELEYFTFIKKEKKSLIFARYFDTEYEAQEQIRKLNLQNIGAEVIIINSEEETNQLYEGLIIKRGDEGENVRVIQEKLRTAGYYYGNSAGIFGPITEEAVKRFQAAHNLGANGVVDALTLHTLLSTNIGSHVADTPSRENASKNSLSLGDKGKDVMRLQQQLIKLGYLSKVEVTGYYDSYTVDAVRRFQRENYLSESGNAGPTTRAKLDIIANDIVSNSTFEVLELQRRLQARGLYTGPLNGVLTVETKKALLEAQLLYSAGESNGLAGAR